MDNKTTNKIHDKVSQTYSENKPSKVNPVVAALGGLVTGASTGPATSVATISQDEFTEVPAEEEVNCKDETDTPTPEQVILANDEGIRYAHINADNFGDAFAQARQQVGPGGVFEYNGRLYGTYYENEWNNMSAQEKADYQNRVNEIAPSHNTISTNSSITDINHNDSGSNAIPTDAEMISAEPIDNEIRILGIETVQDEDGQIMNVALVDCDGDQALLVDVDNNGTIDILLHDDNGDGEIQESEIQDISEYGLEVADIVQTQAVQQGDTLFTSADDMPDYINDADSIMTV